MAKPVEGATSARLAFVSIVEWVIFFVQNEKNVVWGKFVSVQTEITCEPITCNQCYPNPQVCESMGFDPGPEVVRVNRNYV